MYKMTEHKSTNVVPSEGQQRQLKRTVQAKKEVML